MDRRERHKLGSCNLFFNVKQQMKQSSNPPRTVDNLAVKHLWAHLFRVHM